MTTENEQRAYPFPDGEFEKVVTVTEDTVTFKGLRGPKGEVPDNDGCQIDAVIRFARKTLEVFNGRVPSRETALAITKLEEAELWLIRRTVNRAARGVEGTMQK